MAANTFQTRGPAICAHGAGFTPHGEVSIKYRDLPTSPYPNETSEHIAGSADAEGLMSLHDSSLADTYVGHCETQQLFHDVSVVITDVASGDVITTGTLPACMFCLQSLCPTSVGGGCP